MDSYSDSDFKQFSHKKGSAIDESLFNRLVGVLQCSGIEHFGASGYGTTIVLLLCVVILFYFLYNH